MTEKHWTAGISCEELSKRDWCFKRGVGTREELAVPMHIAGACSRIATALERIADLMDPVKKAAADREHRWNENVEKASRAIRGYRVKGSPTAMFRAVMYAIENGHGTDDPIAVIDMATNKSKGMNTKTAAKLKAEVMRLRDDGGAK